MIRSERYSEDQTPNRIGRYALVAEKSLIVERRFGRRYPLICEGFEYNENQRNLDHVLTLKDYFNIKKWPLVLKVMLENMNFDCVYGPAADEW